MDLPLVHVLVINWNGRDHLDECFRSLLRTAYKNCEFVLLDNASADGSVEFVQANFGSDPRVAIVELGANLGWSRANNKGIERALESRADYVFLLNNDTATSRDSITALVETMESDPTIGALSPKLVLYDHPQLLNSIGLDATLTGSSWDIGLGRLDAPRWNEPRDVLGVCGAAMMIRTAVLQRTGLLPIDFDIYYDDLDLCLRIWDAGYRIRYCPDAVVRHKFSATMGSGQRLRLKYYLNNRNRLRMILRNYPLFEFARVAWRYILGECRAIGRSLFDRELWKIVAHVRSWFAGIAYIPSSIRERFSRKSRGLTPGSFWNMIRTDLDFFSGIELPDKDGWYAEISMDGRRTRPMSSFARLHVNGAPTRIESVAMKIGIAPARVTAHSESGERIAEITEDHPLSIDQATPIESIELRAERSLLSEDSGLPMDVGALLSITPLGTGP